MASGPITSWQIDGETVTDFIFLGCKVTADSDCNHEIAPVLGSKVTADSDSNHEIACSSEEKLWPTQIAY